jgi:hypothetical protein
MYSSAVQQMKLNLTALMFPVAYIESQARYSLRLQSVLKETELALSEDMIPIPAAHTLRNVARYHP